MRYADRAAAGRVLADHLRWFDHLPHTTVLGLARGGIPVASVLAANLGLPLDVLVVRKLGLPWAPEVAFGALGACGVEVRDGRLAAQVSAADIALVVARERAELVRRETHYRGGRPNPDLDGRIAIIVDDGLATGATARAAIGVARRLGAARVILAVPVGALDTVTKLGGVADKVVCPLVPANFSSVSAFYRRFEQVPDRTVLALLAASTN